MHRGAARSGFKLSMLSYVRADKIDAASMLAHTHAPDSPAAKACGSFRQQPILGVQRNDYIHEQSAQRDR
jgi:hypothetical protein